MNRQTNFFSKLVGKRWNPFARLIAIDPLNPVHRIKCRTHADRVIPLLNYLVEKVLKSFQPDPPHGDAFRPKGQ